MHYALSCLFISLLAAPGAPPETVNVIEIFPDSFEISWSPLSVQDHNGEITGYNVTVTATNTGESFTVFSETNSTTVKSLTPFTTYTYAVAAATIAGIGPYSIASTVVTGEAGTYVYCEFPVIVLILYIVYVLLQHPPVHQKN